MFKVCSGTADLNIFGHYTFVFKTIVDTKRECPFSIEISFIRLIMVRGHQIRLCIWKHFLHNNLETVSIRYQITEILFFLYFNLFRILISYCVNSLMWGNRSGPKDWYRYSQIPHGVRLSGVKGIRTFLYFNRKRPEDCVNLQPGKQTEGALEIHWLPLSTQDISRSFSAIIAAFSGDFFCTLTTGSTETVGAWRKRFRYCEANFWEASSISGETGFCG